MFVATMSLLLKVLHPPPYIGYTFIVTIPMLTYAHRYFAVAGLILVHPLFCFVYRVLILNYPNFPAGYDETTCSWSDIYVMVIHLSTQLASTDLANARLACICPLSPWVQLLLKSFFSIRCLAVVFNSSHNSFLVY